MIANRWTVIIGILLSILVMPNILFARGGGLGNPELPDFRSHVDKLAGIRIDVPKDWKVTELGDRTIITDRGKMGSRNLLTMEPEGVRIPDSSLTLLAYLRFRFPTVLKWVREEAIRDMLAFSHIEGKNKRVFLLQRESRLIQVSIQHHKGCNSEKILKHMVNSIESL